MRVILANAFSLQMLSGPVQNLVVTSLTLKEIKVELSSAYFLSIVGHSDTANILTELLGKEVKCNRESIILTQEDILVVAQVIGGRLPEGATTIPEGTEIQFLRVELRGDWRKSYYDRDGGDLGTIEVTNSTWHETFNCDLGFDEYEGFNLYPVRNVRNGSDEDLSLKFKYALAN